MIIDTSALVAILTKEPGHENLARAIASESGAIPAPACVEFVRVAGGARFDLHQSALALLAMLERRGTRVLAFSAQNAATAMAASLLYGTGNGRGGTLNLLDLMVYAVAKDRGEPLLFTGRDFTATDVGLHPASRLE